MEKTPSKACYYSFRSFLLLTENKKDKDYSDYITVGDCQTGKYHVVFGSLRDTIHNYNIKTENTKDGVQGYPYGSSTIIVTTADQLIINKLKNL